jgi:hypothetical protein
MTSLGGQTESRGRRSRSRAARISQFVVVSLAILIVLIAVFGALPHGLHPTGTTAILLAIAILFFAILAWPEAAAKLTRRLSRLQVGSLQLAFAGAALERAQIVSRIVPVNDEVSSVSERPKTGDGTLDLIAIREELDSALGWIRERMPRAPDSTSNSWLSSLYVRLGHQSSNDDDLLALLCAEHLLPGEVARFISQLWRISGEEITGWPSDTRNEVLDSAWNLATHLKSKVFDQLVRRTLQEADCVVADFEQRRGHRPDFLVYYRQSWYRMTARRIMSGDEGKSKQLGPVMRRLRGVRARPSAFEPAFDFPISCFVLVVPDGSSAKTEPGEDPRIVAVGELPGGLIVD